MSNPAISIIAGLQDAGAIVDDSTRSGYQTWDDVRVREVEMLLRALPKRLWRKALGKVDHCSRNPCDIRVYGSQVSHGYRNDPINFFGFHHTLGFSRFGFHDGSNGFDNSNGFRISRTYRHERSNSYGIHGPHNFCGLPDSAAPIAPMSSPTVVTSPAPTSSTASTPPARTHTPRQGTNRAGPKVRLAIIRVEPPPGQKIRRHHYAQPENIRLHPHESTVTCRSEPAPSNRPKTMQPQSQEPALPNHQEPVKLP
ncbi:hypothetical protein K440DRAFT_678998 [Wilcoxina mikolae CBS 423.85]|nr:hypothetical protein K440DRAFT_678998 [Wilcoxina mikolae CBS 423.85]